MSRAAIARGLGVTIGAPESCSAAWRSSAWPRRPAPASRGLRQCLAAGTSRPRPRPRFWRRPTNAATSTGIAARRAKASADADARCLRVVGLPLGRPIAAGQPLAGLEGIARLVSDPPGPANLCGIAGNPRREGPSSRVPPQAASTGARHWTPILRMRYPTIAEEPELHPRGPSSRRWTCCGPTLIHGNRAPNPAPLHNRAEEDQNQQITRPRIRPTCG